MLKTVKNGSGIRVDPPPPAFSKFPHFPFFWGVTSLIKMASIGRRYATSNWYDDMMKKWKWRMCLLQWLCSISKFRIWNQKCQPWLPSPCFTPMLVSFTSFSPPSIGSGEMPTCPSRLWMAHELGPPADLRPGAPEAQKQEAIIPRWVKDPYYHDI